MNIKGYDVNHLAAFARETVPDRWENLFEKAGLPTKAQPNGWYPLKAFAQVLMNIEEETKSEFGAMAWEYGHYSAKRDARGAQRLLFVFASPNFIMKRANTFWSFYHDFGRVVLIPQTDNSVIMCLQECAGIPKIYLYNVGGWTEQALMLAGSKNPLVKIDLSDPNEPRFDITW